MELTVYDICSLFFDYSIGGGQDVSQDSEGKKANAFDGRNESPLIKINDTLNKNYAFNKMGDTEMIQKCNRINSACFTTGAVIRDKLIEPVGEPMIELSKSKEV